MGLTSGQHHLSPIHISVCYSCAACVYDMDRMAYDKPDLTIFTIQLQVGPLIQKESHYMNDWGGVQGVSSYSVTSVYRSVLFLYTVST